MKNDIKELIAKTISDNYYDLLLVGYEEQQHRFFITLTIIDFITKLREKNINYDLNDIFLDTFLELIDKEANSYIGK